MNSLTGMVFPSSLQMLTYDVAGRFASTGMERPSRQTGLVVHTGLLLAGLHARFPDTRVSVTTTGRAADPVPVRLPHGQVVMVRGVDTRFPEHLSRTGTGKDAALVHEMYEERVEDERNPVYRGLAWRYTVVVRAGGTRHVLAQNINPMVSLLKAEEFGLLCPRRTGPLNLTCVIHDLAGASARFGYLARRLEQTGHTASVIAVSGAVRDGLIAAGVDARHVRTVFNGMDTAGFLARLEQARSAHTFDEVRRRNHLPATGTMVLMSARRVRWKGQEDLLDAVAQLHRGGELGDAFVVINGHNLLDTRDLGFQRELREGIEKRDLGGRVWLLDDLSQQEVVACYAAADVAVLPSREPEPFGYANIEAMLAEVPVVATAHGGPLDYLDHGHNGLLVPPRDPAALAAALRTLITDREGRQVMGAQARRGAERFSLDEMVSGYAAVIAGYDHSINGSDTSREVSK